MRNMGPHLPDLLSKSRAVPGKNREWLISVDIHTLDDVAKLGAVEAYKRVEAAYPDRVSLNMLWGLQAALLDILWSELPPNIKEE